jgi:hypothetical protein
MMPDDPKIVALHPERLAAELDPAEFLTEREAYKEFAKFLSDRELLLARNAGAIGYVLKGRSPRYARREVWRYILCGYNMAAGQDGETACSTTENSASGDTGSTASRRARTGTDSGMTPALERSASAVLGRQTRKKQKSPSPRSRSAKVT